MRRKHREHSARENRHVRSDRDQGKSQTRSEEELYDLVSSQKEPLLLILDCVQDPHNLGAILRTADAAGVTAVITPKDKSAGVTDTVRRVAVGAADVVPFFRVTNLSRTMRKLKEIGIWMVGTSDLGEGTLYDSSLTGPTAIVMGAEGSGMRRLTEDHCDFLLKIPMAGRVECLNVSVATGVCLYEAVRQRQLQSRGSDS